LSKQIFSDLQGQQIVDTLLMGYNRYAQMRMDMAKDLELSGSFAWTKSNFLDDAFAKAYQSGELEFIEFFEHAKAGESWEYLEFFAESNNEKILLMVKNFYRLEQTFEKKSGRSQSKYLLEKAQLNQKYSEAHVGDFPNIIEQLTLDIIPQEISMLENVNLDDYSAFFVLAYDTDVSKQINRVRVVLPDPISQRLVVMQDLTQHLALSSITPLNNEEFAQLPDDELPAALTADYEIVVPAQEKEDAQ